MYIMSDGLARAQERTKLDEAGGGGALCPSLSRRILGCWARLQLQQRLEVEEGSAGTRVGAACRSRCIASPSRDPGSRP